MARPFQRAWKYDRVPEAHGSEESHALARALAEISDPLFLESVLHAKSALDRFGGEFYIGAFRLKFDREGNPIKRGNGDFETVAYACHWNSRNTAGEQEPSRSREEVVAEVETEPNGEGDSEAAQEAVASAADS